MKREIYWVVLIVAQFCWAKGELPQMNEKTLAGYYSENRGEKDQAKELYSNACKELDGTACYSVGLMAWKEDRWEDASQYFLKACDLKDSAGCYAAGTAELKSGNQNEARKYFEKACDQKSPWGCQKAATLHALNGDKKLSEKYEKLAKAYLPSADQMSKMIEGIHAKRMKKSLRK